jgi:hypothetical protein
VLKTKNYIYCLLSQTAENADGQGVHTFISIFFRLSPVLGGAIKSYFNYSVSTYDGGYVLRLQYKL